MEIIAVLGIYIFIFILVLHYTDHIYIISIIFLTQLCWFPIFMKPVKVLQTDIITNNIKIESRELKFKTIHEIKIYKIKKPYSILTKYIYEINKVK